MYVVVDEIDSDVGIKMCLEVFLDLIEVRSEKVERGFFFWD